MQITRVWEFDFKMLQLVVELQVGNNGTFPLDQLMDKVGLLDRGDSYPNDFTPWIVIESLRRLEDGGFIFFAKNPFSADHEVESEAEDFPKFIDNWFNADDQAGARDILLEEEARRRYLAQQHKDKRQRINEALYKGTSSKDVYWRSGRFYVDSVQQAYELRSTSEGLRRVGAWPNPEKFSEDLIEILGNVAQAIEGQHPQDAKKLREVGKVLRGNLVELTAAVVAKVIEHAAGL